MQDESGASQPRLAGATAGKSVLHDFAETVERGHARGHDRTRTRGERALPSSLFRYRVVKRALDIVLILLALPVLLLALLVVGTLVRLTSPGPVFFSHRRIRREGEFFSMWKFRTMCVNSSDVLEQHLAKYPKARTEWRKSHKLRVDPRITPIGLFLRRYSLDELPQVWNVLRGQMSLVGAEADRRRRGRKVCRAVRVLHTGEAGRDRAVAGLGAQQTELRCQGEAGLRVCDALVAVSATSGFCCVRSGRW